jgi:hypothetical protein
MDRPARVHYPSRLSKLGCFRAVGESPLKYLVGILVAAASAAPAFAFQLPFFPFPRPHPVPAPAPDLAIGAPAVLAVIGAYVIARLVVRARATQKADI